MCLKESLILEKGVIICFAQKITLAVCLPILYTGVAARACKISKQLAASYTLFLCCQSLTDCSMWPRVAWNMYKIDRDTPVTGGHPGTICQFVCDWLPNCRELVSSCMLTLQTAGSHFLFIYKCTWVPKEKYLPSGSHSYRKWTR